MAEKLVSASSSSNKRMGVDRLSALPDSLLISILSLLSTREAVMTCVLSKRWHFLWTDLPALEFQEKSFDNEKISEFVATVHKTLAVCGGNYLQRFEVSFNYESYFASDVNAWVQFALKHKVEDVVLLLKGYGWGNGYILPQMMYCNSYLTRLSLLGCIMAPKKTIEWGALSSLYLDGVELGKNVIENILSGCPVLYDLTLKRCSHCSGLNCLYVNSQSLRELTIIGWDYDEFDDDNEMFMEISAPFIHYARISVYVKGRKFKLTNISSLVKADIDFEGYQPDAMSKLIGYTKRLFKKLHYVKELKVGPEFIWALGDLVVNEGMQLSQSGLECLKLNANVDEYWTHGIICLLESSPNLKTLYISLCCKLSQDGSEKVELNHDLLHLKTVKITVDGKLNLAAEPMLTLVQLLLKRTPILEKMVIEFTLSSSEYSPNDYIKITQTLLSYPRASTKAAVLLAPVTFFC